MSPRQSEVHLKDGSDSSLQTRWTLLLNVAMDECAAVRRRLRHVAADAMATGMGVIPDESATARGVPERRLRQVAGDALETGPIHCGESVGDGSDLRPRYDSASSL